MIVRGTAILLALLLMTTTALIAQSDPPEDSVQRAELVNRAMELAHPGPEHDRLSKLAGEWEQEISIWMEPGSDSVVVRGTASNEMILGGRFLRFRSELEFMGTKGESLLLIGYDRRYRQYTILALDTWGTYFVTGAGQFDESSNSITVVGEDYDPILQHTQVYEMTFAFEEDDSFRYTLVYTDDAHTKGEDPFKMVDITHRRKK